MKKKKIQENWNLLRELHEEEIASYEQEAKEIVDEVYENTDFETKIKNYNQSKKLKWWHYLISLTISLVLTAIALIIGFVINFHIANYVNYGIAIIFVVIFLIVNWKQNHTAAIFFNDKRKRYQRTLTEQEAKNFLTLKIIFWSFCFFLPTLITLAIIYK